MINIIDYCEGRLRKELDDLKYMKEDNASKDYSYGKTVGYVETFQEILIILKK